MLYGRLSAGAANGRDEKMRSKQIGLTAKEKAFCHNYVIEGMNATQAYLNAYNCAYTTANGAAFRVLKKQAVRDYIEALQKEAFAAACISAEKVAMKLADVAFAAKDDEIYTPQHQLKALDLLQKQLGLQHQKIEADVATDITITIEE